MSNLDPRMEKILRHLQSPKAGTRFEACEELRVAPALPPEAIQALQAVLTDKAASVADAARKALEAHTGGSAPRQPSNAPSPADVNSRADEAGMTCPNCGAAAGKTLLRCHACGEIYDRRALERLQHLDYLLAWLEARSSVIGERLTRQLQAAATGEREAALAALRPAPAPVEPEKRPSEVLPVPVVAVEPAVAIATPMPAAAAIAIPPQVAVPSAEAPHPAPPQPKFDWATWWERTWNIVVSGALLRGLLYLGALMIVVSAAVLVVRFWDIFPRGMQLAFIAAVPTSFYLASWLVRTRLKLPQAGGVLAGIGALLLAVDFVAVFQLGGLAGKLDATAYWLGASVICTAVYLLSAWRLPTEFFGYITLLGLASTLLAFARLLHLPLEWQIAVVSAMAPLMIAGSARLGRGSDRWVHLAHAGRRLAHAWLLASIGLVAFVPGRAALGQMATFILASLGFGLLASSSARALYAHLAVWTSIGAWAFLLRATALPGEWYAVVVGALSIGYTLAGRRLTRPPVEGPAVARRFSRAIDVAGWSLLGAGILGGFAALALDLWAGVAALTLGALILCWQSRLRNQPVLGLLGGGLFVIPFPLAVQRVLSDLAVPQPEVWLMATWAGLALAYLGIGVALGRAPKYAAWFYLLAHALAIGAILGELARFLSTQTAGFAAPTLASLGGVILVYGASAALHDSGRHPGLSGPLDPLTPLLRRTVFLWPVGALLPIWLAVAWHASALPAHWLGVAIGTLAIVYVGLGVILARRKSEYHWPPDIYAHVLCLAGILVAIGDRWALLASLYLAVGALGAVAFARRWAWQATLASLLLLWPFELSLELSPLRVHVYSLAYAALASVVFVPLGNALGKAGRRFAFPQHVMGYAVAALALLLSLLGRFGIYAMDLPWVGVITPLVVSALLAYGVYRFRAAHFAWAAVGVFAIAYGQALTLVHVPVDLLASAWIVLALVYVLCERAMARVPSAHLEAWRRGFRLPLPLGAVASGALGLVLTAPDTAAIFAGTLRPSTFPAILAQALGLVVCLLSARLYRSRWLMYVAAVLSFFPYTSAWIGYGPNFSAPQTGWIWTGLAAILLVAGFALDRSKERYAHGPYLVGYLLGLLAIGWSAPERLANIYTLAAWLVLLIASQLVVHRGRHRSFDDFVNWIWRDPRTIAHRAASVLFLGAAALVFPIGLTQLLTYHTVPMAWQGLALALTAPLYIAAGLALQRAKAEYTWPLYGVGYALTAIGAMVAFEDQALAIYVLGIDALVYAVSAYIFRQGAWLYLSTALVPVIALITLNYNGLLNALWVAPIFMGLAFVYFGAGRLFDRGRPAKAPGVTQYALPFYAMGYLLSAVALAVASTERGLALEIYSSAVVLYGLAAWSFREPLFLYPAVWLAGVPYYLGMTMTGLSSDEYGLGWLPLILLTLILGRAAFHKQPLGIRGLRTFFAALPHPAMPFYLLAYGLSVSMILLSRGNVLALTLALTIAAALYFGSAGLFRRSIWLFPGLLAAHAALATFLMLRPSGRPEAYAALPFLGLTWVVALLGEGLARRFPVATPAQPKDRTVTLLGRGLNLGVWPFVDGLDRPSWSQPFFLFAVADVFLWQIVAQPGLDVSVFTACGFAVLLGLLAMRWSDPVLAHVSLAFAAVAVADRARWNGMAFPYGLAWLGGLGFAFYLLARIVELVVSRAKQGTAMLEVWRGPLTNLAVILTSVAVVGTLPWIATYPRAFVAALAFCGALYLAIAYRGRYARLGYLGLAMLELAWILALLDRGIQQPQLYAIPSGLYFSAVGTLEVRQGRKSFGSLLEAFGLCVLVITAFIQSLNGAAGFPYFVLLLAEGLAIIWWGAAQRRKVPFLIGLAASVLNVIAQVVVLVNVYQVERWVIVLAAGLLLVSLAVFVERKREQIISAAREWRDALEAWG